MAKSDKPRKERIAPDEARERLTNATIELLKTEPFPKSPLAALQRFQVSASWPLPAISATIAGAGIATSFALQ
jgi:hypothetical protein